MSIAGEQIAAVEAQRLSQRTKYDLEMLEETGFVKGIENYSRYLTNREPGEQPAAFLLVRVEREAVEAEAVDQIASVYDLHATLLHLLGLNHERLSFYHNGIERRLIERRCA
mgnify:CR=1 FL=1